MSEHAIPRSDYTPWRATKFYVPLVVQAVSQSLTYPLVAAIVSRGENGVLDLASFAQGLSMMFVIGAIGGGLLTTGMVFGRDAEGFRQFRRLNLMMTAALLLAQAGACLPGVERVIFRTILGLSGPMGAVARQVLLYSIPLQFLFFLRHPPLVALYNARASAAANWATLFRIALTAAVVPLFIRLGWVGHKMGLLAMTLPVALEMGLATLLARPYIRGLGKAEGPVATMRTQLCFTIPLSFGGVLLAVSGFMVAAFIARADEPGRMQAIHYVVMGVVNPMSYAAIRMQAVVLAFPPQGRRATDILRFALVAGCALMLFPLAGQIPAAARWYFGAVQNLPDLDIPLAMRAMLIVAALPVMQAVRGHAEGLAARMKRPNAILAGQAVYLASMVCTLFVCLNLGVPGYLMGITAILVSVLLTLLAVRVGLLWAEMEETFGRAPRDQSPADE
ncbi:MAG: hypothetical protein FWG50_03145 [Kiritimatiellaeota bacterium]|nr:hypothetical protein [Kiritimatiellota bacterium]